MSNDGLTFSGWVQPPIVPPDPIDDGWRGPPGPQGIPGPPGLDGSGASFDMRISGAVGDGTTDDGPVIQAWLNSLAVAHTGAEVVMPPGYWYAILSAPLEIPANVIVRGAYSAQNNQVAGGGLGFFSGGGFLVDPALPYGIRLNTSSTLKNVKVYRTGMVAAADASTAGAAYTAWAAEAFYRKSTGSMLAGATVIPMTDTSGIVVGMPVRAGNGAHLGPGAHVATVQSIVADTSVTLTNSIITAQPAGIYFRFGGSVGVVIGFNCSSTVIDEVQIIGFRTGIQVYCGQYWIRKCRGDCSTNIEILSGGDTASVTDCEFIPLYGQVSQSRPAASFFIHDGGLTTNFYNCFTIGWLIGWHLANAAGPVFNNCGSETLNAVAEPDSVNWLIERGNTMQLHGCHAQAGAIGFHIDGAQLFLLFNCSSNGYQVNSPTTSNIAHFLVENLAGGPADTGSIINPSTNAGYPDKVPFSFGSTGIASCNILNPTIFDIARSAVSTTVPFVAGSLPNTTIPRLTPGLVFVAPGTGATTCLPYWNGVVIGNASTAATMTITLPPYPADKQTFSLLFNSAVTALTIATSDGSAVGKYANPGDGTLQEWIYLAAQDKWFCGGSVAGAVGGTYLPLSGGTLTGTLTTPGLTHTGVLATFGSGQGATALDITAGNTGNVRFNLGASTSIYTILQGGGASFRVLGSASAPVNRLEVQPNVTGQPVIVHAAGSDTDVGLTLSPQGAGVVTAAGPLAATSTFSAAGTVSGAGITALLAPYAPLASPTFTGTVSLAGLTTTGSLATYGSGTGATPFDVTFANTGSNVRVNLPSSTSVYTIQQAAVPAFRVLGSVSAPVNFLAVQPSLTGVAVAITADGTDTDVSLRLAGKGAGVVAVTGGLTVSGTSALTGAVSGAGITSLFASPPALGGTVAAAAAHTTISATGVITSTLATGTAPFTVASTTVVANLNASALGGATFAAPGAIGGGTPAAGAFTTLSASSTISGAGFSTYLASPPAIGGTAAAGAKFTTLEASSTVSGAGITTLLTPYALLAGPTFTGTPTLPTGTIATTQAAGNSTTALATTAFVAAAATAVARTAARLQAQWVNGAIVTNDTVWLSFDAPYAGTINTLKYFTGNGSFTVAIQIGGVSVTSLSAVAVSSATPATATATGLNTFAAGAIITAVITSAASSPTDALLSLAVTWS